MNIKQSLQATGIGKRYGNFVALDDIHLEIQEGEFLTLLGPSGSGKTTFLMILAGFLVPDAGQLIRAGQDVIRVPPEKRNFGMVFQGYALFPHMTVAENIDFPLKLRGMKPVERQRKVTRILDVVGLGAHKSKKPAQLSGGQQQRVAIARALVFEPELLLLDEPLSALDKNLREQLQSELQRIHREVGTSFVFVTHDQSEALALSTRIAIFNQGRLEQASSPRDIYERPISRFVAEFIGKTNTFDFSNALREGNAYAKKVGDHWLRVESNRIYTEDHLVLAVRPEHLIVDDAPRNDLSFNSLHVTVHELVYQGPTTLMNLRALDGTELQISVPSHNVLSSDSAGHSLYVSWPISAGTVLPY
ncbi:ABC transporter ATP-binding protein [Pseudomonas sp. L13]|uniref:ABC transporter ATP-binding protein n=1 Tax=Pseudomonas sp. L13 TaxID=343985 RepID=UPI00137A6051|nr:ABC transporter ATP-binding protein [Pseudomonas sp. L13]NCE89190.1 ABC transporter ATP-binding protein [Pseudomonas sp. L13]